MQVAPPTGHRIEPAAIECRGQSLKGGATSRAHTCSDGPASRDANQTSVEPNDGPPLKNPPSSARAAA